VQQTVLRNNYLTLLISEYSGESLFDFCFCHNVAEWTNIVSRDITLALTYLHSREFAYVDLHPGNIVCNTTQKCAKLVDLESLTPLEVAKINCRVMEAFLAPGADKYRPRAANDFTALRLVVAWMDNTMCFRDAVQKQNACDSLKQKILALPQPHASK
jgi:hypothetical protein